MRRGVRDLATLHHDEENELIGGGCGGRRKGGEDKALETEAERARRMLERQRTRMARREKVQMWVRETILGRCWL